MTVPFGQNSFPSLSLVGFFPQGTSDRLLPESIRYKYFVSLHGIFNTAAPALAAQIRFLVGSSAFYMEGRSVWRLYQIFDGRSIRRLIGSYNSILLGFFYRNLFVWNYFGSSLAPVHQNVDFVGNEVFRCGFVGCCSCCSFFSVLCPASSLGLGNHILCYEVLDSRCSCFVLRSIDLTWVGFCSVISPFCIVDFRSRSRGFVWLVVWLVLSHGWVLL